MLHISILFINNGAAAAKPLTSVAIGADGYVSSVNPSWPHRRQLVRESVVVDAEGGLGDSPAVLKDNLKGQHDVSAQHIEVAGNLDVSVSDTSMESVAWKTESMRLLFTALSNTSVKPARSLKAEPQSGGLACFIVNGLFSDKAYRDRSLGIAQTWGQPKFVPEGARLLYLVGATGLDPLPGHEQHLIRNDQLIVFDSENDPAGKPFDELQDRVRHSVDTVFSRFKDECNWFLMTDDDAYVNMSLVVSKLRCLDSRQPHYMGSLKISRSGLFVHGDLKIFSAGAMPIFESALSFCTLRHTPWEDVALAECLRSYQNSSDGAAFRSLEPKGFGRRQHNNTGCDLGADCLSSASRLVARAHQPECLDVIHKVVGAEAMQAVHQFLQQRSSCGMGMDKLMEAVDATVSRVTC